MTDYYLKFSSEDQAFSELKKAGYTAVGIDGEEFVISATHEYCIDLVGTITKGGKWEYVGEELVTIEEPIVVDGYHVNIRMLKGDASSNLNPFIINGPKTPYRIFG